MSPSSQPVDLTGQTLGLWTVVERIPGPQGTRYRCVCECGTEKTVRQDNLRSGRSRSCGCLQRKPASEALRDNEPDLVHRHADPQRTAREYGAWTEMLSQCLNPNVPGYRHNGGRGITLCERWLSFESFLEDMGLCPSGHTLGRIDNGRGFEPGNCRWAKRGSVRRQIPQPAPGGRGMRTVAAVATSTREQKVAVAQRLRAQGLTMREVGELLAASPWTVGDWLNDPDGSRTRARKERYRGTCIDCGGPTTGGLGRGPNAPLRCRRCSGKAIADHTRQRAQDRFELIALLWAQGKTSREIEVVVGGWTHRPGGLISSMRSRGYDLPYRYNPDRVPNMQEAARENLRKARAALAGSPTSARHKS